MVYEVEEMVLEGVKQGANLSNHLCGDSLFVRLPISDEPERSRGQVVFLTKIESDITDF